MKGNMAVMKFSGYLKLDFIFFNMEVCSTSKHDRTF